MKKKIIGIAAVVFCVLFLFSGCSLNFSFVETLMQPPVFFDEYAQLQKAFSEAVKEESVLCAPVSGEHRSAIVLQDIDGDSQEEAFIFYAAESNKFNAAMYCFEMSDGRWNAVGSYPGSGSSVYEVGFVDLDNNGVFEILVSWSLYEGNENRMLSVFMKNGSNRLEELVSESVNIMQVLDIDGDTFSEILVVTSDNARSVGTNVARAFKLKDGRFSILGETKLDSSVSKYVGIQVEKSADLPTRVYIDAAKGESQMITEVIYIDAESGALCNHFYDEQTASTQKTLRNSHLRCNDVNNDGVVDIPVQIPLKGANNEENAASGFGPMNLTQWINADNGKMNSFSVVKYQLVNETAGFSVDVPPAAIGKFCVKTSSNEWQLYACSGKGAIGEKLASVVFTTPDKWNKVIYRDYTVAVENESMVVGYLLTEEGIAADVDNILKIGSIKPVAEL